MRDIIRIPIGLKIATGTYILQANRASFNRSQLNPICLLCGNSAETLEHFLLTCNCLDGICAPLVKEIINTCSALFAKNKLDGNVNLIQVLVNPYVYSTNGEFTNIIRDQPFNLTTQELECIFLSRKARKCFQHFNIRLYDKNSESDYFFFLHQNQNIFFNNIGNQNIFLKKTIIPPSS